MCRHMSNIFQKKEQFIAYLYIIWNLYYRGDPGWNMCFCNPKLTSERRISPPEGARYIFEGYWTKPPHLGQLAGGAPSITLIPPLPL